MTLQMLIGVLLVCLGLLLGTTWTIQALHARLRRQAEERRRLNEEWMAIRKEWSMIRTTRHQLAKCPHTTTSRPNGADTPHQRYEQRHGPERVTRQLGDG